MRHVRRAQGRVNLGRPGRGPDRSTAASGVTRAKGTLGDLIDRYIRELYSLKPWGRSKSADLKRLTNDLGVIAVSDLTSLHITRYFQRCRQEGSGGVTISAQIGYLVTVLNVARTVWYMDTPVQAARDARTALAEIRLIRKSSRRDRRACDVEIQKLLAHLQTRETDIAMADIVQFCVASAMRISEVCRLQWQDVDEMNCTVTVRDRKHPSDKLGGPQPDRPASIAAARRDDLRTTPSRIHSCTGCADRASARRAAWTSIQTPRGRLTVRLL